MDTTELQNQAIEIRDAENEGENTALRVGTMLLAIIDAFANIVDLDTLQQILEQYAGTTGSGQIYWRHARCVFLASMGADFDAVNGDGWEYTNHNGDIVFNPTSKNLRVVGETGTYFVTANVLYVHAHTCHTYKWDAAEQKMVEITDTNLPTVITYKNTPPFSQVAIGESYVFQSQSSGPKIAIKISSSETYSFLPDPKKIYAFRDIRQAMLWKPSNQTWVSLTPRVINDLTTGGEGDALSAEMGKKIRQNITILLSRLGNYAFPNGKPTLDWSGGGGGDDPVVPTYTVQKTIGTGLSATGGDSDVAEGDSLEVSIAITNNLYIVDDDSVVVTMGGSPVQGAWNASTMKVTIAAVTGNVVINVPSMTYVDGGHLVVMFDGKNRGGVAGEWTDLKDNTRKLILTNCTENTDSVTLDGSTSTAMAATAGVGVDVPRSSGTIEAVATGMIYSNGNAQSDIIIANKGLKENGNIVPVMAMGLFYSASFNNGLGAYWFNKDTNATNEPNVWLLGKSSLTTSDILHLSLSSERAYLNGVSLSRASATAGVKSSDYSRIGVFSNVGSNGSNVYRKGTMYCARIYDKILSADEVAQNYKVDRKRFNLI